MEYRAVEDEHEDAYYALTRYAFNPTAGPAINDFDENDIARATLPAHRGIFEDGELKSVCGHIWFDGLVRGEYYSVPGLTFVATPPEHRRSGYVAKLMECSLSEYRERGDLLSILWPFKYRFYRRLGWEACSSSVTYSCDPSALSFARDELGADGSFQRVEADEFDRLTPVYDTYASEYGLSIARSADWWRYHIFESWDAERYVYTWEKDGDVRAYLAYTIQGEWSERTLHVVDLATRDLEGLLAILTFLSNHDSQVATVRFRLPTDIHLLDLVTEPEEVTATMDTGAMARIVDVTQTLPTLCEMNVDAALTVAVADPLVDWNNGTFDLSVSSSNAKCTPSNNDAGVTLDIGHLTQLAVGYRSAGELSEIGKLDGSPTIIETMDQLFPAEQTYLGTGF